MIKMIPYKQQVEELLTNGLETEPLGYVGALQPDILRLAETGILYQDGGEQNSVITPPDSLFSSIPLHFFGLRYISPIDHAIPLQVDTKIEHQRLIDRISDSITMQYWLDNPEKIKDLEISQGDKLFDTRIGYVVSLSPEIDQERVRSVPRHSGVFTLAGPLTIDDILGILAPNEGSMVI